MSTETSPNWQQDLIDKVKDLQRRLEESRDRMGISEKVKSAYSEALTGVDNARSTINRLAAIYNNEYSQSK